ncbi:MAG: hypothetical protein HQK86_14795 [Nitrospinae bacterium]|nr:hypothetical protein [Nitrospinota bacterium]
MKERTAGASSLSIRFVLAAVFVCGAAVLLAPGVARAASCCGGSSGASLLLPKFSNAMMDVSVEMETYDGYWNGDGAYIPDPPGSSLRQYRLNLAHAWRVADNWQVGAYVPLVLNDNRYEATQSGSQGVGDAAVSFWYETFDNVLCVAEVRKLEDLRPAIYLGAALTVPTGVSPFDNVKSSFDVTGRGFYRLDLSAIIEKTVYPWNVSFQYSYGVHMERAVNREYGEYVEPYHKKLGDRRLWSFSGGYTHFHDGLDFTALSLAYSDLWQGDGTVDGRSDPVTALNKRGLAGTVAWTDSERKWTAKFSWSHVLRQEDWGRNFPATEVLSMGLSYVYR